MGIVDGKKFGSQWVELVGLSKVSVCVKLKYVWFCVWGEGRGERKRERVRERVCVCVDDTYWKMEIMLLFMEMR